MPTTIVVSKALLSKTLALIAALESSNGTNLEHKEIQNPSSIHYGDKAIGRYGMMPKTMALLKETDDERAAKKLALKILSGPGRRCPLTTAVVLWERGPNHKITKKSWMTGRYERAKMLVGRKNSRRFYE